jgi:cephalosporin-C deacetylase
MSFSHNFPFDPSYGYTLESLLQVKAPDGPPDFITFWKERYERALKRSPQAQMQPSQCTHPQFKILDFSYLSTDDFPIHGWLVLPREGQILRGVIVGHGYGGREQPDFDLRVPETVWLFLCFRGLARSRRPPISDNPYYHVLHDIDKRHRYILGGCVEDLWLAVSVLLRWFPQLEGQVGYVGISFSGGIGALALPCEERIQRAHLKVPTFGHQPLRLTLLTQGSGEAVRHYYHQHAEVLETLQYYDAATAARYIRKPMQVAAALFDPMVAPPGQFAIHNALQQSELWVLPAGHFDYPEKVPQEAQLKAWMNRFFSEL